MRVLLRAEKSLDNVVDAQVAEVGVGLSTADKENGLAGNIGHGERSADLVVLRVSCVRI